MMSGCLATSLIVCFSFARHCLMLYDFFMVINSLSSVIVLGTDSGEVSCLKFGMGPFVGRSFGKLTWFCWGAGVGWVWDWKGLE